MATSQEFMDYIKECSRKLKKKQFQAFKLATYKVIEVDRSQVDECNTLEGVYGLIVRKVTDKAPFIVNQMLGELGCPKIALGEALATTDTDIDKDYPNLYKVLMLGHMAMSMKQNDYKKFVAYLTKNTLSDYGPDHIESPCNLMELLIDKHQFLSKKDDMEIVCNWLVEAECSEYLTDVKKYCKKHNRPIPKQVIMHQVRKWFRRAIAMLTVIVFVTTIALFIPQFVTTPNETNIPLGTLYGTQTMLLVSYDSLAININVTLTFDTMETSNGPINIDIYKSHQLPDRIFEQLPTKNWPGLCCGRHNYNYDGADVPIFLQSGSTINYTLYSEKTCPTNTTTPALDTCTRLYLFDNHKDYDNFRNGKSNLFQARSPCAATDIFPWGFNITHNSPYYVILQADKCHNVNGSVSVTQASYNSSGLNQICGLLNSSRQSCSNNLCHKFFGCGEDGHILATIPGGKNIANINYKLCYGPNYNSIAVSCLVIFALLLLICVCVCFYSKCIKVCKCCSSKRSYNRLSTQDTSTN